MATVELQSTSGHTITGIHANLHRVGAARTIDICATAPGNGRAARMVKQAIGRGWDVHFFDPDGYKLQSEGTDIGLSKRLAAERCADFIRLGY